MYVVFDSLNHVILEESALQRFVPSSLVPTTTDTQRQSQFCFYCTCLSLVTLAVNVTLT